MVYWHFGTVVERVSKRHSCRYLTGRNGPPAPKFPETKKTSFIFRPSAAAMAAAADGAGGPPAPGVAWAAGVVLAVSGLPRARRAEVQAVVEAAGGRSGPACPALWWQGRHLKKCLRLLLLVHQDCEGGSVAGQCRALCCVGSCLVVAFFCWRCLCGRCRGPRQQKGGPVPSLENFVCNCCYARVASPGRLALLCGWQLGQFWLRQDQAVWVAGQVLLRTDSAVYAPAGGARHDQ